MEFWALECQMIVSTNLEADHRSAVPAAIGKAPVLAEANVNGEQSRMPGDDLEPAWHRSRLA